jgi:hypothetical protein
VSARAASSGRAAASTRRRNSLHTSLPHLLGPDPDGPRLRLVDVYVLVSHISDDAAPRRLRVELDVHAFEGVVLPGMGTQPINQSTNMRWKAGRRRLATDHLATDQPLQRLAMQCFITRCGRCGRRVRASHHCDIAKGDVGDGVRRDAACGDATGRRSVRLLLSSCWGEADGTGCGLRGVQRVPNMAMGADAVATSS